MMKPIPGWADIPEEMPQRPSLPNGAYVCQIKQVSINPTQYGEQIVLVFDICEGEYTGFYTYEFDKNPNVPKKWKGTLKQFLPKNDGSEADGWSQSRLKGLITAFEHSNPGFTWNWDEQSLVGKRVGILTRKEEWAVNGKSGWSVRPFRAISIDRVHKGDFTLPKDKPLKDKPAATTFDTFGSFSATANTDPYPISDDDSELPF